MSELKSKWSIYKITLNILAIAFTILNLAYGFIKGFDSFELIVNIAYYSTIIFTQLVNLMEISRKN